MHEILERLDRLEKNVKQPFSPYMLLCAAHSSPKSTHLSQLNYHSLLYSYSNIEEGGLDLCTGVFTSGQPGTYSVTWGALVGSNIIVLRKNGKIISESHTSSKQGRSMIQLDKGETLDLYCNVRDQYEFGTQFCVSLVHAHQIEKTEGTFYFVCKGVSKNVQQFQFVNYEHNSYS